MRSNPTREPKSHLLSPSFEVVLNHIKKTANAGNDGKAAGKYGVDSLDMKIIQCMLANYSNAEIAKMTGKPLSTVQRRTRSLLERGYVKPRNHLDFAKFGLRRGLLHFKCKSANLKEAVGEISRITGVESVGAYLGSLDVIANVVYEDSSEVLEIIAKAQKLDLITDVAWSEEIHSMP